MKGLPVALATTAAVALAPVTLACSPDSGGTECQCADPTVQIEVPADLAPAALGVTLSGRGCATATAQCTQPAGSGCALYEFQGTGVGACDVDVTFGGTPADFNDQVSFVQVATCCPNFYIQPSNATPIEVPDLTDAGAAG
jgi:hypothetical protein